MLLDLVGVDHHTIVDDHWLSYDRLVPVEVELGGAALAGNGRLRRDEHAAALHATLRRDPACDCYGSASAAEIWPTASAGHPN